MHAAVRGAPRLDAERADVGRGVGRAPPDLHDAVDGVRARDRRDRLVDDARSRPGLVGDQQQPQSGGTRHRACEGEPARPSHACGPVRPCQAPSISASRCRSGSAPSGGIAPRRHLLRRPLLQRGPPLVGQHTPGDSEQPRPGVLQHVVQPSPRDEERLRHHVLRHVPRSPPQRIRPHRRTVLTEQPLESLTLRHVGEVSGNPRSSTSRRLST